MRRRSNVPVPSLKNQVQESWKKGLNVGEIVDELRSNREYFRKKRPILMIKVKKIVKSLNKEEEEEEEGNGSRKKQRLNDSEQRSSDFDILSGTDELEESMIHNSDDDMNFDYTSDGLRASYSNKSRTTHLRVEEKPKKKTEIVQDLGFIPCSGLLLHGPPGCGKTTLAHAIATETGVPFYMLSAPELVSGVSGGSEENIRQLFSKAYRTAPSIIFIDEIDAIGSKRENQHKATNRPDSLDLALRRRFQKEIYIGVPDAKAREEIFSSLTRNLSLESNFDMAKIVRMTYGFVGSDFDLLLMEAGTVALKKSLDSRETESCDSLTKQPLLEEERKKFLLHTTSDFVAALKKVQPCLTREGFSTRPNVTWDDVGGLDHIREEFYHHVIRPIKFPEEYKGVESCLENGFLLYGPPGCGKSLVAMAVANEAGANFIHVKGPDLLSKYVGDTEKNIRELFSRARMSSPCIVFFDEVDSLTTERGEQGAWVVQRPLTQLLVELSGGEERNGVIVIAATNRPDMMDAASKRKGRFGKHFHVPLPNSAQRYSILKSIANKFSVDPSVDLNSIAKRCENLSGADLKSLVDDAVLASLKDKNSTSKRIVKMVHFEQALTNLKNSAHV
ncbi:hypothetical protein AALP_AA4G151500 [Arabis alpina]|uniref:AAA+ ATPase domain-containing protein n=1 Tax=Arabis alpina TaxID=50452 RepID=A0A087H3E2_ARAAL|nr:hypothetical protein AALP_AA4G151500 [Arabis alpina]